MRDADDRSDVNGAGRRDYRKSGERENGAWREQKQQGGRAGEHGADRRDVEAPTRIAFAEPVGEIAADQSADETCDTAHGAEICADLGGIQMANAAEKWRRP